MNYIPSFKRKANFKITFVDLKIVLDLIKREVFNTTQWNTTKRLLGTHALKVVIIIQCYLKASANER